MNVNEQNKSKNKNRVSTDQQSSVMSIALPSYIHYEKHDEHSVYVSTLPIIKGAIVVQEVEESFGNRNRLLV